MAIVGVEHHGTVVDQVEIPADGLQRNLTGRSSTRANGLSEAQSAALRSAAQAGTADVGIPPQAWAPMQRGGRLRIERRSLVMPHE